MKFRSVNELETFNFQDCVIKKLILNEEAVRIEVEALIVNGSNSQNRQFFASYIGETVITLEDSLVEKIVLSGSKTYDADGNLLSKVDDRLLKESEYPTVVEECKDAYLSLAERIKEENGRFTYMLEFEIPSEEEYDFLGIHFYEMTVSFADAVVEWDRYMNRV